MYETASVAVSQRKVVAHRLNCLLNDLGAAPPSMSKDVFAEWYQPYRALAARASTLCDVSDQ